MTKSEFETLQIQSTEFSNLIEWIRDFSRNRLLKLSVSFQNEETVLIDHLKKTGADVQYFTLDTGRLPQETYDLWGALEEHFQIRIQGFYPESSQLDGLVRQNGINGFYESVAKRKECCRIRKVLPLARALQGVDGWITGLRKGQSLARWETAEIEWDEDHQAVKLNPLADWSYDQVSKYVSEHKLPYNKLYDQGYTSIGCAACTRAVKQGEDLRAGRWWWEEADKKECGLHVKSINTQGA